MLLRFEMEGGRTTWINPRLVNMVIEYVEGGRQLAKVFCPGDVEWEKAVSLRDPDRTVARVVSDALTDIDRGSL